MDLTGAELILRFLDARRPAVQVLLVDLRAPGADALRRLAASRAQRVPLVIIGRQVARKQFSAEAHRMRDRRAFLENSCHQWFHVGAAAELLQLLPTACTLAERLRGPVFLEIPEDVFAECIRGAWIPSLRDARLPAFGSEIS
jgi:thiamine pyrophosphate-dependent acetolactate synthase large subunit-like protein